MGKEDMKEEYGEYKDMMAGVNQQNMMNVNFAPINNNAQNWVNINTQVGTDVDVNVNSPSSSKDGKDWGKDWEKDEHHMGDEHHDEVDWNSDKMMWLKEKLMEKVKETAMWKLYEIKHDGPSRATHQGADQEHDRQRL